MAGALHRCFLLGLLLPGCHAQSADPGLAADLFVHEGQFVRGPMPSAPGGGPQILSIMPPRPDVQAGGRTDRVSGLTEPSASAVLLALAGDDGYWIVNTGAATLAEPGLPTFDSELGFARGLSGSITLLARAVDRHGLIGPEQRVELAASALAAQGELVVTLRWESAADLDLHVIDPLGEEVWAGNINSYKRPPIGSAPSDRQAWMNGGILDLDANASCVQDSRREENAVWAVPAPSGSYEVRVATAAMCGAEVAHWMLEVQREGRRLLQTRGTALGSDTRHGARRGAGVDAASFTVP